MEPYLQPLSDPELERRVIENVARWQSGDDPLAALSDSEWEQLDVIQAEQEAADQKCHRQISEAPKQSPHIQEGQIHTVADFVGWMKRVEHEMHEERIHKYTVACQQIAEQSATCSELCDCVSTTTNLLKDLQDKYAEGNKSNSLHNLSEQLIAQQEKLREIRNEIHQRLHYFQIFQATQDSVERCSGRINSQDFIQLLEIIDKAMQYLSEHMNFREARIYKMKYESLLSTALNKIYRMVNNVFVETTKQITEPQPTIEQTVKGASNNLLLYLHSDPSSNKSDSVFDLFYGQFQTAAVQLKIIMPYLEQQSEHNEHYANIVQDCHKTFVAQRLPLIGVAVQRALGELKDRHRTDFTKLFRTCGLFLLKTCQDEVQCYYYFFAHNSTELQDYLAVLCQHLYDTLRPSLITINHVEILCEVCAIFQKELLNERIMEDDNLEKYVDTVQQLWQDVKERLVFRTNVYFNVELQCYRPSPGDLAYPEKLQHLEAIVEDLQELPESGSSSQDLYETSSVNQPLIRSFTGNSPADLHGMWYPTVKRTLVMLSRLYMCLDRDTFQGLAQEALLVCIQTVSTAANSISTQKTQIDGCLFEIKHLLIIREQIAPFQVDFTARELQLDFSTITKAAGDLIQKRDKIFVMGPNNALLEFLLEGTPRVREYLVDSRKELDKQLKTTCESFISAATTLCMSALQQWIRKADEWLRAADTGIETGSLSSQSFGEPKQIATIVSNAMRLCKSKVPDIQRSMQLYLANKETEFILFRPIKNNIINLFIQMQQVLNSAKYSQEEQIIIGCPTAEQINVLLCSVSLNLPEKRATK